MSAVSIIVGSAVPITKTEHVGLVEQTKTMLENTSFKNKVTLLFVYGASFLLLLHRRTAAGLLSGIN